MSYLTKRTYHLVFGILITGILLCTSYIFVFAAHYVGRPVNTGDEGINKTYLYGEGTAVHKGVDFSNLTLGEAILSVSNGTVVGMREDLPNNCYPGAVPPAVACSAYGNYVLIRHNQRHYDAVAGSMGYVYSLYLHIENNGVSVDVGNTVTQGQQIATGDDTGDSTNHHLHFQLIIHNLNDRTLSTIDSENRTRNPELWLAPRFNTARMVGKITDANGTPVQNLRIHGLQNGAFTVQTYSNLAISPSLKSDEFLAENFATTDITPGTHCLEARNSSNQVYRNLGCYVFTAGVTTYVGLYPVFLPDVRGSSNSLNSSITIRNNSTTSTAQVVTTYIKNDQTVAARRTDLIAANGTLTFVPPADLGEGSAVVSSSEDVGVVVVHERTAGSYVTESYLGVDKPSTEVVVPIVQKNNGTPSPWFSHIFIQNTSSATINATLEFTPLPIPPNSSLGQSCTATEIDILPYARRKVTLSSYSCIGTTFVGSVRITSPQPLAVASTQYTADETKLMETSNTQPGGTTLYAPLIQNNNANTWISGLTLRRVTNVAVTVQFHNNSNNTLCHTAPGVQDPNTGTVRNPEVVFPAIPLTQPSPCPATPWGKFTASSNMFANVNQLETFNNVQYGSTTYAAIAAPTTRAIVPRVRRQGTTWSDGFVILNTHATTAAGVTVSFFNANGTLNSGFSPTINAGTTLVVLGQVPTNFDGSAVIVSNVPIAVSANAFNPGGNPLGLADEIGSYPALHR